MMFVTKRVVLKYYSKRERLNILLRLRNRITLVGINYQGDFHSRGN